MKSLLVAPKKRYIAQKSLVLYTYKCNWLRCDDYIGESARTFWGKAKGTSQATFPHL